MRRALPLVALIGAAVAVRLALFTGLVGEDDHFIFAIAHDMATGQMKLEPHHMWTRVGMVAPMALTGILTNWHPNAYPIYGFACSIGTVVLAWALGRAWFSPAAGLVAGCALAFYPNNIIYAGAVHVDVPSAFWFALAIFLLWPKRPGEPHAVGTGRALAAGLCLGVAYLTKEMMLLGLPWLLIWFWRDPTSRRRLLWAAAGLALVVAGEAAAYTALGVGPLHRIHSILPGTTPESITASYSPLYRWTIGYPRLMFRPNATVGVFYPLTALAVIGLLAARIRGWGFLFGWWAVTAAFIIWTPGTRWPPMPVLNITARYLEALALPAALLIGLAVTHWKRVGVAALVAGSAAGILGAWKVHHDIRMRIDPLREALPAVASSRVVHTDFWSASQRHVLNRMAPQPEFRSAEDHAGPDAGLVVYSYGVRYERFIFKDAPARDIEAIQRRAAPVSRRDVPGRDQAESVAIYRGPW
jgi:hypothetical protein